MRKESSKAKSGRATPATPTGGTPPIKSELDANPASNHSAASAPTLHGSSTPTRSLQPDRPGSNPMLNGVYSCDSDNAEIKSEAEADSNHVANDNHSINNNDDVLPDEAAEFLDSFDPKETVGKDEGCDPDNVECALPDFKTEDIKPFENCSDFANEPGFCMGPNMPISSASMDGTSNNNIINSNSFMSPPSSVPSAPPAQPLRSNVLGKSDRSMEHQQYMQQASLVYVFSTEMANQGTKAVVEAHFPSLIAWHESRSQTKEQIEAMCRQYPNMAKTVISQNARMNKMKQARAMIPPNRGLPTGLRGPTSGASPMMSGSGGPDNGLRIDSKDGLVPMSSMTDSAVSEASTQSLSGTKVPNENLNPEQRQLREQKLNYLNSLNKQLFPEEGNNNTLMGDMPMGAMGMPRFGSMPRGPVMGPDGMMVVPRGPRMPPEGMMMPRMMDGRMIGPMGPMGPMGPNGPSGMPMGPHAQMEWQKMQQQFMEKGKKGNNNNMIFPGGPMMVPGGQMMGPRGAMVNRMGGGPPPPYPQGGPRGVPPGAMASPNPGSPATSLPMSSPVGVMNSPRPMGSNPGTPVSCATLTSPVPGAKLSPGTNNSGNNQNESVVYGRPSYGAKQGSQQSSTKDANLMPVPSPQQIQYLNPLEGQELTIQKQPNTSLRESDLSPSVPNANTPLSDAGRSGGRTSSPRGGPSTPSSAPAMSDMLPKYPGPHTPNSEAGGMGFSVASPQTLPDMQNARLHGGRPKTPATPGEKQRFVAPSPGGPRTPGVESTNRFPGPQMSSRFPGPGGASPNPQHGMPGAVHDNQPLNPSTPNSSTSLNMGKNFDPISSMAQMSQQLTTPSMPGSDPLMEGGGGMMSIGRNGNPMVGPEGMTSPQNMGPSPNGMGPGGMMPMGPMGPNGPMMGPNGPMMGPNGAMMGPMGGSMGPMRGMMMGGPMRPGMERMPMGGPMMCPSGPMVGPGGVPVMGPGGPMVSQGMMYRHMGPGPVDSRMMAPTSSIECSNGPNSTFTTVKASAPNTIQYLPSRSQFNNEPRPRGPPNLDFIRYSSPNNGEGMPMDNSAMMMNRANGSPMLGPDGIPVSQGMNAPPASQGSMSGSLNGPGGPPFMGPGGAVSLGPNGQMMGGGPVRSMANSMMGPNGPMDSGMYPMGGPVPGPKASPMGLPGSGNGEGGMMSVSGPKSSPMGMMSPSDPMQPMPPMGASGPSGGVPTSVANFKNLPIMGGPTTSDPAYAQQFHNFQQQLYATNTRSSGMQQQGMSGGGGGPPPGVGLGPPSGPQSAFFNSPSGGVNPPCSVAASSATGMGK